MNGLVDVRFHAASARTQRFGKQWNRWSYKLDCVYDTYLNVGWLSRPMSIEGHVVRLESLEEREDRTVGLIPWRFSHLRMLVCHVMLEQMSGSALKNMLLGVIVVRLRRVWNKVRDPPKMKATFWIKGRKIYFLTLNFLTKLGVSFFGTTL